MPMPGLYSAGRGERLDIDSPIAAGFVEDSNDGVKSSPLRRMCLAFDRRGGGGGYHHTRFVVFFAHATLYALRIICFRQCTKTPACAYDAAAGMHGPIDTLPDALASDELQSIDTDWLDIMYTNLAALDGQTVHGAGLDGSSLTGDIASGGGDSAVAADRQPTAQRSTQARVPREGSVPPGLGAGGASQSTDGPDAGHLLGAAAEAVSRATWQDTQHSGEAHGANEANAGSEHDAEMERQQQVRDAKPQEYSYVAAAQAAMAAERAHGDGDDPHEIRQQPVYEGSAHDEDIRHEAAPAHTGVAADDKHWAPETGETAETDQTERVARSPEAPAGNATDGLSENGERYPDPYAFGDSQPEDGMRAGEAAEDIVSGPGEDHDVAHGEDDSEHIHTAERCVDDDGYRNTEYREELHCASPVDASNTAPMEENDPSPHPVDQQHYSPDPAPTCLHPEAFDEHQAADETADVHQHTVRSDAEYMEADEYRASRTAGLVDETGRMSGRGLCMVSVAHACIHECYCGAVY